MKPDIDPQQLLFRAAGPADLEAFERIAAASATGINSLPADRAALLGKLERSAQAFASQDDSSGEEIYLFVLEDLAQTDATGRPQVVGTSGIAARAGFADRFYSYRNEMVVHASAVLGASNRIHTLQLCHDLTGVSLLTSFFIEPAYAESLAPQLLSRARLLFIQEFADRFSDRIAAESPGLADDSGRCPFWDAVGRRFFNMDYPQVERLTGGRSQACIGELMPHSPLYVPLLPEEAQWAIGQLHPVGELPFSILLDEGFDSESYVDIFDGGPTVEARVAMLKSVASSQRVQAAAALNGQAPSLNANAPWQLVAGTRRADFRAVLRQAVLGAERLALDASTLQMLQMHQAGATMTLRVAPLTGAQAGAQAAAQAGAHAEVRTEARTGAQT